MKGIVISQVSLAVMVFCIGCSSDSGTEPYTAPRPLPGAAVLAKFSAIQSNVFTTSCALSGCHIGSSPTAGLNLSSGQAYANLVNVPSAEMPSLKRVEPGNSAQSYLVRKLTGNQISGSRMPLVGQPLAQSVIDSIASWINQGAPNN